MTETGVPVEHEQYYAHEQVAAWLHQTLVKLGDGFVMPTEDITARKQAQEDVLRLKDEVAQKATDKLQQIFNSIEEGFCVLEALYDEVGQAFDYRFAEVNPAFKRQAGLGLQQVTGKTFRALSTMEPRWLDTYDKVVKTGEPIQFEEHHPGAGRWYEVHASRIGTSPALTSGR